MDGVGWEQIPCSRSHFFSVLPPSVAETLRTQNKNSNSQYIDSAMTFLYER